MTEPTRFTAEEIQRESESWSMWAALPNATEGDKRRAAMLRQAAETEREREQAEAFKKRHYGIVRLGGYLAGLLDEDAWASTEPYLLEAKSERDTLQAEVERLTKERDERGDIIEDINRAFGNALALDDCYTLAEKAAKCMHTIRQMEKDAVRLTQEREGCEADQVRLIVERDTLKRVLAETQAEVERLTTELAERDIEAVDFHECLLEKDRIWDEAALYRQERDEARHIARLVAEFSSCSCALAVFNKHAPTCELAIIATWPK